MADDKLVFEVQTKATGVKQVQQQTDKMAQSIERSDRARKNAGKSQDAYNKREKALYQSNLSSAKGFSKMNQTIGSGSSGLVGAYATLMANVFALTAAFGALKRAAQLDVLVEGLDFVGTAAGRNLTFMADRLKDITGAAISTEEAMRGVAIGISAGFSGQQMEDLTKVAKGAALALGRDMGDAMSRLTRGAAKLEPEILDELGIMVRLDQATSDYATTVGKTAEQLTQYERRMAFINAINTEGLQKFGAITEAIEPSAYDQLSASLADLLQIGLKVVNNVLGPMIRLLSGNMAAVTGAMVLFGSTISRSMLPMLYGSADAAAKSAGAAKELAVEQLDAAKSANKLAKSQLDNLVVSGKIPAKYKEGVKELQAGGDATAARIKLNKSLDQSDRRLMQNITAKQALTRELTDSEQKSLDQSLGLQERNLNLRNAINNQSDSEVKAKEELIKVDKAASVQRGKEAKAMAYQQARFGTLRVGWANLTIAKDENTRAILRNIGAQKGLQLTWAKTKAAGMAFGMTMKFIGSAILSALPFIGLAITGISLLKDAFGKWFDSSAFEKAADTAIEGMSKIQEASDALYLSLLRIDDASLRTQKTYKTFAGVMQTVADSTAILTREAGKERTKDFNTWSDELSEQKKMLDEMYETRKKAEKLGPTETPTLSSLVGGSPSTIAGASTSGAQEAFVAGGTEEQQKRFDDQLKQWEDRAAKLEAKVKNLGTSTGLIDTDEEMKSVDRVLSRAIVTLSSSAQFKDISQTQVAALEKLQAEVAKGTVEWKVFDAEVIKLHADLQEYAGALQGAEQASASFAKEQMNLAKKVTTPFDKAIDSLDAMVNQLNTIDKVAEQAAGAASGKEFDKKRKELSDALMRDLKLKHKLDGITEKEFRTLVNTVKFEQERLRVIKGRTKQLQTEAKMLSKAAKEIPIALDLQLKIQEQVRLSKVQELESQIIINVELLKSQDAQDQNAATRAKIAALQAEQVSTGQQELMVAIKTQELLKKTLGFEKQINDEIDKSFALKTRQMRAEEELANIRTGRAGLKQGLSPVQEYDFKKRANEEALAVLNRQQELKEKQVKADMEIIRLQFLLLQLQIQERLAASKALLEVRNSKIKRLEEDQIISAQDLTRVEDRLTRAKNESEKQKGLIETGRAPTADPEKTQKELEAAQASYNAIEQRANKIGAELSVLTSTAATESAQATSDTLERVGKETTELFIELLGSDGKGGTVGELVSAKLANIAQETLTLRAELQLETETIKRDFHAAIMSAISEVGGGDSLQVLQKIQDSLYINPERQATLINEAKAKAAAEWDAGGASRQFVSREDYVAKAGEDAVATFDDLPMKDKLAGLRAFMSPMMEDLKAMGPQGEVMAAVASGALAVSDSFASIGEAVDAAGDKVDTTGEKMKIGSAIAASAAATFGAIGQIAAANAKAKVAAIDQEIAAEKKRDGKSKESMAKIAALERKKEATKKKAFETNKKMMMAQTIASTAAAIMSAVAGPPGLPWSAVFGGIAAAMGVMQLSAIASTSYQGGGSAPSVAAVPKKVEIGERQSTVDVAKGRGNVAGELAYLRGERGIGSSASDFRPGGFAGRKYRAAGGFVVGEQGPELMVPQVPGEVMSRSDLMGREPPMNVTFQINAMDTANMEDMLESRRGSIINMIRGAANEHGQDFLEMIDTDTYNEEQRAAGGPTRSYE